jgi:hypothetical protein
LTIKTFNQSFKKIKRIIKIYIDGMTTFKPVIQQRGYLAKKRLNSTSDIYVQPYSFKRRRYESLPSNPFDKYEKRLEKLADYFDKEEMKEKIGFIEKAKNVLAETGEHIATKVGEIGKKSKPIVDWVLSYLLNGRNPEEIPVEKPQPLPEEKPILIPEKLPVTPVITKPSPEEKPILFPEILPVITKPSPEEKPILFPEILPVTPVITKPAKKPKEEYSQPVTEPEKEREEDLPLIPFRPSITLNPQLKRPPPPLGQPVIKPSEQIGHPKPPVGVKPIDLLQPGNNSIDEQKKFKVFPSVLAWDKSSGKIPKGLSIRDDRKFNAYDFLRLPEGRNFLYASIIEAALLNKLIENNSTFPLERFMKLKKGTDLYSPIELDAIMTHFKSNEALAKIYQQYRKAYAAVPSETLLKLFKFEDDKLYTNLKEKYPNLFN